VLANLGVSLQEEQRLEVFLNWVLRDILGHTRNEIIGELRKLHKEELQDTQSSNIARMVNLRRI
jgi:hypothetical protein